LIPLFIEAALMALAGFSAGLLIAYLVALRRRRQY
jgi:LPXTG-motif cell wall-anchored protein